jgi:hypothetical protein
LTHLLFIFLYYDEAPNTLMLNPDNVKAGIIFDQAVASDLTHFSFLDLFSLTADV